MRLMQPLVTICVIGNTAIIVETDNSGGEVMEGSEEGEKSIGRPESSARQIGEVLGDVVVSSHELVGKECAKVVRRR
jgi:hypothetical protein